MFIKRRVGNWQYLLTNLAFENIVRTLVTSTGIHDRCLLGNSGFNNRRLSVTA